MRLFKPKHSIGKTILKLRKEKGWTQAELAEKINVTDKAVSKWESEAGCPDILQFPMLAEVFDVSIDYIMSGKTTEHKFMSRMELCAKNDDVSAMSQFPLHFKDEDGKGLIDYVLKYNSKNIFKKILFDEYEKKSSSVYFRDGYCDSKEFSKTLELMKNENYFDTLMKDYGNKMIALARDRYHFARFIIPMQIEEQVLNNNYPHLTAGKTDSHNIKAVLFPYYIYFAYYHNKTKLLKEMLEQVASCNSEYIEAKRNARGEGAMYRFSESHVQFFLPDDIMLIAKERSDVDNLLLFNQYLANPEDDYTIAYTAKMIKLKKDKKVSNSEIIKQSCIHGELVCIEDLVATHDFNLIKSMLAEYPISFIELFHSWLSAGDFKKAYRFAIDKGLHSLARAIARNNADEINRTIVSLFWSKNEYGDGAMLRKLQSKCASVYFLGLRIQEIAYTPNIEWALTYYKDLKNQVIEELALKMDKSAVTAGLTKEFFEEELAKGNIDMVVIKLCVKLEAILKCDYHYTGDFSEMLRQYCSTFETFDNESNSYDPKTPKLLNILRQQRNSCVHSEICKNKLDENELKYCIDFICKLD